MIVHTHTHTHQGGRRAADKANAPEDTTEVHLMGRETERGSVEGRRRERGLSDHEEEGLEPRYSHEQPGRVNIYNQHHFRLKSVFFRGANLFMEVEVISFGLGYFPEHVSSQ